MTQVDASPLERASDGIFALVPIPLLVCDLSGRVVAANGALASEAEVAADELAQRNVREVFLDREVVDEALALWARSATSRPAGLTLRVGADDGCPVVAFGARISGTDQVLIQVRPRREAQRHFAYLSREVEVRDLRELRSRLQRALADLRRTNRRLVATNEELERYASMVSHDLRGPISTIRQFASLLSLSDPPLGSEEAEMVAAIGRLSDQATRVAESLLQLARTGSFEGVSTPVDATACLETAAEQAGVAQHPDVELSAGALPSVRAHESHLVQILANLLGNAVRYRVADRPLRIRVSAHEEAGWVRFVVADDGRGVAVGDRERIFAPNVRGGNVDDAEGRGLGLALCRRLVSGYGGTIELVDVEEPGASFAFTLPGQDPDDEVA